MATSVPQRPDWGLSRRRSRRRTRFTKSLRAGSQTIVPRRGLSPINHSLVRRLAKVPDVARERADAAVEVLVARDDERGEPRDERAREGGARGGEGDRGARRRVLLVGGVGFDRDRAAAQFVQQVAEALVGRAQVTRAFLLKPLSAKAPDAETGQGVGHETALAQVDQGHSGLQGFRDGGAAARGKKRSLPAGSDGNRRRASAGIAPLSRECR